MRRSPSGSRWARSSARGRRTTPRPPIVPPASRGCDKGGALLQRAPLAGALSPEQRAMPEHTGFLTYLLARSETLRQNAHNVGESVIGHHTVEYRGLEPI